MPERAGVPEWDVVIVGAGSAGCALAARLADASRRVLLLEAGAHHPGPEDVPPELLDPATMGAAVPGHPANWDLATRLTDTRAVRVPRGRVTGGSSALNAGVFLRGVPADFDGWAAAGNGLWSWERVLPAFRRLEDDRDFGDRPYHGRGGPVPVARIPAPAPLAEAFGAATAELGFPAEPDKNAGGAPGYGPIPFNVDGGVRTSAARAYLAPRRHLRELTVRGGAPVRRVVLDGGRAVGVETAEGVIRAAEVVLSAGAVGSPHLLLLSGIGPAGRLRAAGLPVVADVPGVGREYSDHPIVYVGYRPFRELPTGPLPLHGVLHTTAPGSTSEGDLEVLPWLAPFSRVMARPLGEPAGELALGVGLQRGDSRGELTLDEAHPERVPHLDHGYLRAESDRRRLRAGVRLAVGLLQAPSLAPLVGVRTGPPDDVLAHDGRLDRWIGAHVTTAVHLAGTARMGPDTDPGAVVDQHLRVRGVSGLRIADTSVMPQVTSRGTAATAVMIGERAAELMTGG